VTTGELPKLKILDPTSPGILTNGRYTVKLAETADEVESALRLRHDVFNVEMGGKAADTVAQGIEFDAYDRHCRHLIVTELVTGRTIGTYRLNSIDSVAEIDKLYSHGEFTVEDLPPYVLENGIETGRACVAAEHRNTKVLFLLWKGLAHHLLASGKKHFFGCCSIFTRDHTVGEAAYKLLIDRGHFHETLRVEPRKNALYSVPTGAAEKEPVTLPGLFEMYLRIGAKVCGPPMMDEEFGTVDFFVVFDLDRINERYRRMFFS